MEKPSSQLPASYWVDQIRADLEARKSALCRHGAKTCHDCEKPDHKTNERTETEGAA